MIIRNGLLCRKQPSTKTALHRPPKPCWPARMTKRKKIVICCVVLASLYLSAYVVCRVKGEMIHRKTWAGGWNRHWITAGHPEPSIQPLPYAPLHVPGDDEYNAAMEQFRNEFRSIRNRRLALGVFFFPLRCLESIAWWCLDPKN
jgi:hypothetical protein